MSDDKQPLHDHKLREQAQPESRQFDEAKASSEDAPTREAGLNQPELAAASVDLNALGGLNGVQRFFEADAPVRKTSDVSIAETPLGQELEWARVQRRRRAGHEPFIQWDMLTRYERGMAILQEQLPLQHPSQGAILVLCTRLQENIDHSRISGENPTDNSVRMDIIRELNNLSAMAIHITFTELCGIHGSHDSAEQGRQELPKTRREVADWYTGLNWRERCYVIATCVLQGAPSHEVSRAANELYSLIEKAYPAPQTAVGETSTAPHIVGPSFISAEDLLERTFAEARKLEGAERIMWRDEAFDPLVREFLARQATTVGMQFGDHNLLDILQAWAISDNEERAFRAARVVADLWWRQHQDKLLSLAEVWAASDELEIWQGGAALLYGAYAAERTERSGLKSSDSIVLLHLRKWADWREDSDMALVAAYAYGLLGRYWPDVALDGLDHLLCFGATARKYNTTPPPHVLFLSMLSYVELASAGHIRPLLRRFAEHADHYTLHARDKSHGPLEPASSRDARERSLNMLFFHFVFLAALSLTGVRKGSTHMPYLIHARLSPRPDIPNSRGQDVLLAGVLSELEPEWRTSIQTILCAAISTGREQLAFDLLASWIHIVTFEPKSDALNALLQFVQDLYSAVNTWDAELQKNGLRSGSSLFLQRLRFWANARREDVLRPFAQRILEELDV